MIKKLFLKYKEVIAYLFFGVCTTLVNIASYYICTRYFHIEMKLSTGLAWCFAVAFAYITNKKYVFVSKNNSIKAVFIEFLSFISCRLFTGAIDLGMMFVFVEVLKVNDILIKIASNFIVIIVNYIASRLFIFTEHNRKNITE